MIRVADRPVVGVLALQGGVAEHLRMLETLGARAVALRKPSQVSGADGPRIDALILPGGESTTIDRLARALGMFDPLRAVIRAGVPTLGTCAGLILLASRITDAAPGQRSLAALDIDVRRNAWGSQLASTAGHFVVAGVNGTGDGGRVRGALIRAPEVRSVGPGARVIAESSGRILGVTSAEPSEGSGSAQPLGAVTGVAFHPELTGDPGLHLALLARAGHRH